MAFIRDDLLGRRLPPFSPQNPVPKPTPAPRGASSDIPPWPSTVPPGATEPPPIPPPAKVPLDYEKLLSSDEVWQQLKQQLAAMGIQNVNTRNTAFTRGIGQGGFTLDPSQVFSQLGIDPNSPEGQSLLGVINQANPIAEQNTVAGMSAKARLEEQNKNTVRQIMDLLGAQGMARSGLQGKKQRQQDLAFRQSNYDAIQSLLDYMSGAQTAYLQAEGTRRQQYAQYLNEAMQRQYTMANALGPTTDPAPAPTQLPTAYTGAPQGGPTGSVLGEGVSIKDALTPTGYYNQNNWLGPVLRSGTTIPGPYIGTLPSGYVPGY